MCYFGFAYVVCTPDGVSIPEVLNMVSWRSVVELGKICDAGVFVCAVMGSVSECLIN